MADEMLRPAKRPCSSCPYRRDVASGIWAPHEYEKLLDYDGQTWEQNPAVFMCHADPEKLCAGWVGCHGPCHLLALRFHWNIDPETFDYKSPDPLFRTGEEAMRHGIKDMKEPGIRARRAISKLSKKLAKRHDEAIDWYALSNGLSTVMPDGTLIHGQDEEES